MEPGTDRIEFKGFGPGYSPPAVRGHGLLGGNGPVGIPEGVKDVELEGREAL